METCILRVILAILLLLPLSANATSVKEDVLSLLIDADFSNNVESSESIRRGVVTALSEVGGVIKGKRIVVEPMDHRGNVTRSMRNIEAYKKSPNALAMISGIHSSPLLAHREFINKNEILFLDPWAAAGPITRYPSSKNWIFRLSIDDSKAGGVIVAYAVDYMNAQKPCLLLEHTGWGESNLNTLISALRDRNLRPYAVQRFNWGLKLASASALVNTCVKSGADSIYMVANSMEGASLVRAIAKNSSARALPIFSHWGITGGAFQRLVSSSEIQGVQLHFLQTQFSFLSSTLTNHQALILKLALTLFEDYDVPEDIQPVTGFVHAYDLTRLLLRALEMTSLDTDIKTIRRDVRTNLERLDRPVEGLIKTYVSPFSVYSTDSPDAHEALSASDIAIGVFTDKSAIVLLPWAFTGPNQ